MAPRTIFYIGKKNSRSHFSNFIRDFQLHQIRRKEKRTMVDSLPPDILTPPETEYIRYLSLGQNLKGFAIRILWLLKGRKN